MLIARRLYKLSSEIVRVLTDDLLLLPLPLLLLVVLLVVVLVVLGLLLQ